MTGEKEQPLTSLNQTLTSVENELLKRKSNRDDDTIDQMLDQVNKLVDDDVIDVKCGDEEPGDGEGDSAPDADAETDSEGDTDD